MTVLAQMFSRLEAVGAPLHVEDPPPEDGRWTGLTDAIGDASTWSSWFEASRDLWPGRRRDVGGSYLSWGLSRLLCAGLVHALCAERRGWVVDPAHVAVRRHEPVPDDPEPPLFDAVSIRARLLVLADDPAAGDPATVVCDHLDDLVDRCAQGLVQTLDPVFDAVRTVSRFGRSSMWGTVADDVQACATYACEAGVPLATALATGDALTAALRRRARLPRVGPTLETVGWSGGAAPLSVKGTCCLWYLTQDAPDPRGEGYCGTCPKRDRATVVAEHRRWLESAGGG